MILNNSKNKIFQAHRSQRGNAIVFLFAAIGMAGTVAYGLNNVMRGPGVTATEISRKSIAENNLIATSRLAIVATTAQLGDNADCDGDGFIEPLPYRNAGALPHPVGGGLVPMTLGASISDPWGTQYGYCVWDHGTVSVSNAVPACGGATPRRLQGAPTEDQYAISIISAGKDGVFQTTCNGYVDTTPADGIPDTPLINTPASSDDIVLSYTYAEANGIGGGIWKLKDGDTNTAVTNKNVEAAGGATFTGGPLSLQNRGLVLPGDPGDDSVTGPCDEAKDQQMRRNVGDGSAPPKIEICDFSGTGAWSPLVTGVTYNDALPDQEVQKLIASDGGTNDYFSVAMAAYDETLVIGTYENQEAAYIYNKEGDSWIFHQKVTGSDTIPGDRFGRAVAISGDMMAISAPLDDDGGTDTGSIYIFKNVAGTWTQTQRLVTSDRGNNDQSGNRLAMEGGTLLVGVTRDDDINNNAGAVYVFNRTGDVWSQAQKLTPADLGANDNFGLKLSISGNFFIVGVPDQDSAGADAGSAYIYKKSGGTWALDSKILPNAPAAGSKFGSSVSISGQTALIGRAQSASGGTQRGDAYIFKNENGTWSQFQNLTASDAADGDLFGYDVALDGNVALISAVSASPSLSKEGKVYIYSVINDEWTERKSITLSDAAINNFMGRSLLLYGNQAFIGSYSVDTIGGSDAGALYIFAPSTAVQDTVLQEEVRGQALDPLDAGLIAHWKMDEGSGTSVRDSIGTYHGTFANSPKWIEGVNGASAVSFDKSVISHISINSMMGMPQQLTWAGWVNLQSYSPVASHFFNIGKCWAIAASVDRGVYSSQDIGGGTYNRTITNHHINGTGWRYIVATADDPGNVFRVYIDGSLSKEENFTTAIAWNSGGCTGSQSKTSIGAAFSSASVEFPMDGGIDDIRLYNRALGPAEVAELSKRAMNESTVRQKPAFKASPGNFAGKISASTHHTCGIKADGTLWCWGTGTNGRLGNGSTNGSEAPMRISDPGPWTSVSAGEEHTCALKANGSAWCWGAGTGGRLGNGNTVDTVVPVPVSGNSLWTSISAADNHTCGVQMDGTAWCWGSNTNGPLGDGTTNSSSVPVTVLGSSSWKMIGAGGGFTCGLKTDGTAWCWGTGTNGRLGNGSNSNQSSPVPVSGNKKWSYLGLITGADMACGIEESGTAWCWGYGETGRLGNGTTTDTNIPTKVSGNSLWSSIVPGNSHTCGIQIDGSAWCWGLNTAGRLGVSTNSLAQYSTPQKVIFPAIADSISVGATHTCGMSVDGKAWCWGSDSQGQLGNGTLISANIFSPYPVSNWINASAWSWNDDFTAIMLQGNHTLGLNGNWMSDDGTSQKYFGFESAGRAIIRQNNTHNQLLIDTTEAASSAQITFRGGRRSTSPGDYTTNRITIFQMDDLPGSTSATGAPPFPNVVEGTGAVWSPTGGRATGAGAIEFGSSNPSRINITNQASLRPAAITFMSYIKPSSAQPAGTKIVSKAHTNNTGAIGQSYGLQYTDTNRLSFITGRTGAFDTLGSVYIHPNRWTHIAAVFDPAGTAPQKRLYVNGVLVASETNANAIAYDTTVTGNLFIGAGGCSSMPCGNYNGAIDFISFYNAGLTSDQVYQSYKAFQSLTLRPPAFGFNHTDGSLRVARNATTANTDAISTLTPDLTFTSTGRLAVGQSTANALVDVAGGVRIGYQNVCSAANAGTIRNDLGSHYECSGNHNNFIARGATQNWWSIDSSADGTKLAAVAATSGQIYTSTDSGVTWTARESSRDWRGIASSADGVKLVAAAQNGQIYTSTDSGVTWTPRDSSRMWTDVASSADGTKLVAVGQNERIYTSTDSGVTWTPRDSSRVWGDVASSADGTKLVAVVVGGQIYTSTDSGVTWIARDSNRNWVNIASSADGTKLATVVQGGQIYTSTDSGATWIARDSVRVWRGIASSADGTKLVASAFGGAIFTSTDSGVSWTRKESTRDWRGIASSADGTKIALVVANGQIYTSNTCAWKTGWATPRQTAMLVPTDPQANSNYSSDNTKTMSVLGKDVAIVGATQADSRGAAYVFDYNAGVWTQAQKIVSNDIAASDGFGVVSNIESDTVMIGATGQDTPTSNSGAVYVFTKSGGAWAQTQKLVPSDPSVNKVFGFWIRISGNRAAIGAPGDNGNIGAIYIFEKSEGIWTEKTKLLPSGGSSNENFSYKFALSGDLLAAGAVGYNTNTGRTYIYERSGGVWSQTQIIQGTDTATGDRFGNIADITGSDILISAWGHNTTAGAAYVFQKIGGTWTQTQKLVASDQNSSKEFGVGLAVQNDTAIITADRDDIVATDTGSAYIFKRIGGTWTQVDKFSVLSAVANDEMGRAFSIYDDRILFGSHLVDTSSGANYGAAYIFEGVGANPNPANPYKYCNGTDWKELAIQTGAPFKAARGSQYFDGGRINTCAVAHDGTGWCWGANGPGSLGNGSVTSSTIPMPIKTNQKWRSLTAGHLHSCGISTDGAAWCWGSNSNGQLGDGTNIDRYVPTLVSASGTWRHLKTGTNTCGIKNDGTAWCWGAGAFGQLGNGGNSNSNIPVQVSGGGTWIDIDASQQTSCGIKTDGTAWCWGGDTDGRLGNGNATTTNQYNPVQVSGPGTWKKISTGHSHNCGIKTDGTAWCWGAGADGQMGNGTTTANNDAPVQVSGTGTWIDITASELTGASPADSYHSCGIKTDGTAWCWGAGADGQMGNGATNATNSTPVQVSDVGPWLAIDASPTGVCAVKFDGTLWCWGSGSPVSGMSGSTPRQRTF